MIGMPTSVRMRATENFLQQNIRIEILAEVGISALLLLMRWNSHGDLMNTFMKDLAPFRKWGEIALIFSHPPVTSIEVKRESSKPSVLWYSLYEGHNPMTGRRIGQAKRPGPGLQEARNWFVPYIRARAPEDWPPLPPPVPRPQPEPSTASTAVETATAAAEFRDPSNFLTCHACQTFVEDARYAYCTECGSFLQSTASLCEPQPEAQVAEAAADTTTAMDVGTEFECDYPGLQFHWAPDEPMSGDDKAEEPRGAVPTHARGAVPTHDSTRGAVSTHDFIRGAVPTHDMPQRCGGSDDEGQEKAPGACSNDELWDPSEDVPMLCQKTPSIDEEQEKAPGACSSDELRDPWGANEEEDPPDDTFGEFGCEPSSDEEQYDEPPDEEEEGTGHVQGAESLAKSFWGAKSSKVVDAWLTAEAYAKAKYSLTSGSKKKPKSTLQVTASGAFTAAPTYAGTQEGYVFATGDGGTGYYAVPLAVLSAPKTQSKGCIISLAAATRHNGIEQHEAAAQPKASSCRRKRNDDGGRSRGVRKDLWKAAVADTARQDDSLNTEAAAAQTAEDLCKARTTTTANTKWRKGGLWAVDTANANSWLTLKAWLPRSSADIVVAQELKLLGTAALKSAAGTANKLKWDPILTEAHRTAADRASGGVLVAARLRIGIASSTDATIPDGFKHRLALAHVSAIWKGGLHVGSAWLKQSEGLSEENLGILQVLAQALTKVRGPWLIGGDWNVPPETLQRSGWVSLVGGNSDTRQHLPQFHVRLLRREIVHGALGCGHPESRRWWVPTPPPH